MNKLIEVKNLRKWFQVGKGLSGKREVLRAVDDISFFINRKEVLGLVGESGCGKTTCGKMLLRIIDPTSGSIFFDNEEITHLNKSEMRPFRRRMMIIYQDPYGSLDPRMRIGEAISEPLAVHNIGTPKEREERVIQLMEKVGLSADQINRYPHEFSGGQRQRIGIARALATNPEFIVADESVSALDVSIQAQIINLLKELQEEFGLTLLFVAHDLSVVKHISDRVAVMYLGKIVEMGEKKYLFRDPKHPYTQALLSAIPIPDPKQRKQQEIIMGDVPSPINPPKGCRFHTRCPEVSDICKLEEPPLTEIKPNYFVVCHKVS
ncbi:MAG: Peptide/nickel transport system ATP-binding protein [Atribacteria bacterium 34_868]|jgi:peptide/nickel transport system ATP-binding protein/oligopeptide transport system ATP-binding protein|nr:MAG: Peptide/nickel transport system ATP-binding protein [Parcubacteria bacterium 34_609]KUK98589.1 MAG: Peptide/nickel transport system ATP-binding protein [Atribacteria bacterium 34_868]